MLIGRSDDPHNPRRVVARKVALPFGSGSRNPSRPAAAGRNTQAGHTTATAPAGFSHLTPLAPTGPSTHDATQFKSARHFAAWVGLVPRQCSTAGRQRLGGISRAGDERLRQLLVLGATAVIQHAKPARPTASPWLLNLLGRKPRKLAAVALANKTARIVWAMMTREEAYRPAPAAA